MEWRDSYVYAILREEWGSEQRAVSSATGPTLL
jgi:hypothetical protein